MPNPFIRNVPAKLTDMALEPKPANKTKAADWPLSSQVEHRADNFKSWFNLLG